MTKTTAEIRIYVADLEAYNNGKLHGCWIDATLELDDIQDQVKAMLGASPEEGAEEYAIHDYEGFGSYHLSEYQGLDATQALACFIEEHGELGGELLAYYSALEDAQKAIEESYCGCYESIADYAQELTEQTGDIPKHLEMYIDYERMGRDMELGGDIFTIELGYKQVHIFWNH